ncbi:TetR/AcrR family transcriptional regulator [Streptomyces sp. DSM 44917]|uniref:TetR/AcrR family transcriptional regulator n=1 Tax=Streptomyces boetiae TaxID=3075541 RepID=A0ABU2L474_9ACTN|nr:TetR/AcrR family transcriptional regulator [Streptomyces sp. DSM 44917]MDT0306312.1 TetR/AcrR family transcriptional regulator [Streptomyces sp. DSM 44917]
MPTARESLLRAARDAVERQPWPVVRMIEVAADAGVSRQTLYNEFGDKAGLGAALTDHHLAAFVREFRRFAAGRPEPPGELPARLTDWIVRSARADRVVRAALTGCSRCAGLPAAARDPGQLIAELWEAAWAVLAARAPGTDARELRSRCETAVRLAVSHLIAPPAPPATPSEPPAPEAVVPAQLVPGSAGPARGALRSRGGPQGR